MPCRSRPVRNSVWRTFCPKTYAALDDHQRDIPRIAKDRKLISQIEQAVQQIPTVHRLFNRDSRQMAELKPGSVHLVVTSPPYWTLKEYRKTDGQLGYVADYEEFLTELDKVWKQCFGALVPGGRVICVVGDVCLSRRQNNGRHTVVPLHASITEHCRHMGYDNLAPIIWHKIANAKFESEGNGAAFLGKPYEPNAVIKNDIEFILMERKPGGYRSPDMTTKVLSLLSDENHKAWFQQIWTGLTGALTASTQRLIPSNWPSASSACSRSSAIPSSIPSSGPAPQRLPPPCGAVTASDTRSTPNIISWR